MITGNPVVCDGKRKERVASERCNDSKKVANGIDAPTALFVFTSSNFGS